MNDIEEVKNRIDIVDLVGHYVTLKKAGANFKGLCPFHHERSPSFMVNPERQIFKCFGCNKGGDVLSFIVEIEKIEFGDALKLLADKAGVTLTPLKQPRPGEAPSEKSRYYTINNLAAQVFHKILIEHPVGKLALEYLHERKVTNLTIEKWRLGYAPRKKVLTDLLIKRGFSPEEVLRAGKPDMFYDRIMFPILDVMGNVVGFTGRVLDRGEPKYLNTPETPIFYKSRLLFGLEKAKQTIKEIGSVIVAEGQMDVISAAQAGTQNIVATSGTALTQDHLRVLARYSADIIFAFDSDGAGAVATKKAIELAVSDGLSVKVIPIPPPHKDIGDVVKENPALWQDMVSRPISVIEWYLEVALTPYRQGGIERKLSIDEKKKVAKELIPVLLMIPDSIEQAHYIQILAKRLAVRETVIEEALRKQSQPKRPSVPERALTTTHLLKPEETLVGLLARSKDLQDRYNDLYNELKTCYNQSINDCILAVEERYRGYGASELKLEIELLVKRYEEAKKDQLKADFAQKISDAESIGNREAVKRLLAEFQQLIKEPQ